MRITLRGIGGDTARHALGALAAVHLLLAFPPWALTVADLGLEASWHQVISHAASSGWQWGRDIDFTYGPLGFIRFPLFDASLLWQVFLWNGVLVAALIVGVLALLRNLPLWTAVATYAVIALSASLLAGKGIYVMLPLLGALLHFSARAGPPRGSAVAVVIAAGIFADVYVSSLVLGAATCALMDASRVFRRRAPVFVPVYGAAFLGAFLLAGQSFATFPAFLRSALEIIAGYPDAMSVYGSTPEAVAYLCTSIVALALVVRSEQMQARNGWRDADAWLLVAAAGAFWFVTWKSGFVRHDLHSVLAWAGLSIGLAAYAAARCAPPSSMALRAAILAVAAATSCAAVWRSAAEVSVARLVDRAAEAFVAGPARELAQGARLVTDGNAWIAARRSQAEAARVRIGAAFPGLDARGAVDMIGFEQGALLARGLDYRPRPVFHDYAAYTRWLIDANQAHWRGGRAASTIFVANATIDNHYPLLDTGKSIVELLTRFRAEEALGDYLRLQRRSAPLEAVPTAVVDAGARWGEWVSIPDTGALVMLEAQMTLNWGGRLLRLALRPPQVAITVKLADGTERVHRVVPAMAAEGFLLSPYAELPALLAAHGAGRLAVLEKARVTAVRLDVNPVSAVSLFEDGIRLIATRIDVKGADGESMPAGLRRLFERYDLVGQLAQSVAGKGQNVQAQGPLLFAHAPATPRVTLDGPGELRVKYGIGDGAHSGGGRTDGVCFRIVATVADGKAAKLHERCLAPVDRPEDRNEQEAAVRIDASGPVEITFETDCRKTCDWDWSYWKDFDFRPARR